MSDKKITLEQVQQMLDNYPVELSDQERRKIAKSMGVELPYPPLDEQLQAVVLKRGHVGKATKANPTPKPKDYITVPSFKMEGDGTKSFWVNATVARRVATRILEVCDAENVE